MQRTIRYPRPLIPHDAIAITAPSSGVDASMVPRFEFCKRFLESQQLAITVGTTVFQTGSIASGSPEQRAAELHAFASDPNVRAIVPPWGGEMLIDILDQLDFELLSRDPKWYVGWSDLSTLLLPLTVQTGLATLHGGNFMDSPNVTPSEKLARWMDVVRLTSRATFEQYSTSAFSSTWLPIREQPEVTEHQLNTPTTWKILGAERAIEASGRLIGGCLDTISMLPGSRFGDVPKFAREYAADGLLVYLENCDYVTPAMTRALHHLRLAGWFDDANAILLGRSTGKAVEGFTNADAIANSLGALSIPVLYDLDIGHAPPQMMLINGAVATVNYANGKGSIRQTLA